MSESRSHSDAFCSRCCLVCGWCPGDEVHVCITTAEPLGIVLPDEDQR